MAPILQLHGISKQFNGVPVLHGVDFALVPGEVHALLGENGAGKSTLMKVIGGVHRPDGGTLSMAGVPRRFGSYRDAVAAGIGMVFQEFSLIPALSGVDNIFLGHALRTRAGLLRRGAMRARAIALLARLGVRLDVDTPVAQLSVAQQQCIEIAKALALDAKVLVLDEPTAPLTPTEATQLFTCMRALCEQGVAIVFISHHLEEIFEVCDRITVLRDGRKVGTVATAGTSIDALVEMMVGRRVDQAFPPRAEAAAGGAAPAPIVLDVQALQLHRHGPRNAFQLREGEILGFAGLVGSGRTSTALALLGAVGAHARCIHLDGRPVSLNNPETALGHGIGLLPEDRKQEGLIVDFSILRNTVLNHPHRYRRGWRMDGAAERRQTLAMMHRLQIKATGPDAVTATLSGGNQQKVVIARWLSQDMRVLVFDEPTRGIDVGAKHEIYALMRQLTARGCAILMISSELPEIVGMCDRVAVFRNGSIVRVLDHPHISAAEVIRHATAASSPAHAHPH